MAKYLVTGAAGFIGSNLCDFLLAEGNQVLGLDNLSNGLETNISFIKNNQNANNFTFIKGDIRDFKTCQKLCSDVDFVLHQAALGSVPRSMAEPLLYNENNITGTLNMLIAARDAKVKRFVFASSSSVYGDTPTLPKEETMLPQPKSPYAISKMTGEYYCKVFANAYGLPTIMLRYFNVFGPRQNPESQYAAAIPKFVTAYLQNQAPVIYGDGEQTRDFSFIQNVINANVNACQAPEEAFGKAINIGCGYRISINDLVHNIKAILKSTILPEYQPARVGDVKDSLADISRAQKYLNYNTPVLLAEGLAQTIDWYQHQIVNAVN